MSHKSINTSDYIIYQNVMKALAWSIYREQGDVSSQCLAIEGRSEKVKFMENFLDQHGYLNCSTKPVKTSKDDEKSVQCRDEGNKLYAKKKYEEAVEKYNESLCYAEAEVNLALAYANRSAVCYELQMYSTCLQNIKLAKSHGYPAEKLARLDERAEKCHRLIAEGAETDENMLKPSSEEFLKLSHPPHPKLPYIADCLEIKCNDDFGRHVITNKKLLPGDVICIETPFSKILNVTHKNTNCANCIDDCYLSLLPCPKSSSAMFCSQKCKDEAAKSFYEYKVEIIDELRRFCPISHIKAIDMFFDSLKVCDGDMKKLKEVVAMNESNPGMSILDVDDPNDPIDVLRVIDSLESHETHRAPKLQFILCGATAIIVDMFMRHTKLPDILKTEDDRDFFRSFLLKYAHIAMVNGHAFGKREMNKNSAKFNSETASAILPFLSMFNHSCSPNTLRAGSNSSTILYALRVIEPGEQLFDSYGHFFATDGFEIRQKLLLDSYSFECKCEACVRKFQSLSDLPLKFFDSKSRSHFMFIQSYFREKRSDENSKILGMIRKLMIKKQSMYPCKELVMMQLQLNDCIAISLMSQLSQKLM